MALFLRMRRGGITKLFVRRSVLKITQKSSKKSFSAYKVGGDFPSVGTLSKFGTNFDSTLVRKFRMLKKTEKSLPFKEKLLFFRCPFVNSPFTC